MIHISNSTRIKIPVKIAISRRDEIDKQLVYGAVIGNKILNEERSIELTPIVTRKNNLVIKYNDFLFEIDNRYIAEALSCGIPINECKFIWMKIYSKLQLVRVHSETYMRAIEDEKILQMKPIENLIPGNIYKNKKNYKFIYIDKVNTICCKYNRNADVYVPNFSVMKNVHLFLREDHYKNYISYSHFDKKHDMIEDCGPSKNPPSFKDVALFAKDVYKKEIDKILSTGNPTYYGKNYMSSNIRYTNQIYTSYVCMTECTNKPEVWDQIKK